MPDSRLVARVLVVVGALVAVVVVAIGLQNRAAMEAGAAIPYAGLDDPGLGRLAGKAAAARLAEAGWLQDSRRRVGILSVEVQTLPACRDRAAAALETVDALAGAGARVVRVPFAGTRVSARDAAMPVVAANPDITSWVVVACNDEGAAGALDALATFREAADDVTDAIGVGIGAREACRAWTSGSPAGFVASVYVPGWPLDAPAPSSGVAIPTPVVVDATTFRDVLDQAVLAACGG